MDKIFYSKEEQNPTKEEQNPTEDEQNPMEDLVNILSKEIPNINNNNENEVVSMIEQLDKGEEPIILKIVSGTATNDEIEEWAKTNDIPLESIKDVLDMMVTSFSAGTDIARNINEDISKQNNDISEIIELAKNTNIPERQLILDKLDNIIKQLDNIKSDVYNLVLRLV